RVRPRVGSRRRSQRIRAGNRAAARGAHLGSLVESGSRRPERHPHPAGRRAPAEAMKSSDSTTRYRNDQAKNLVSFLVGEVRYAVEIHLVREIVNPLPVVALPHAPEEVIGVSDTRGN